MIRFKPSVPLDVPLTSGCVERKCVDGSFWKGVPAAEKDGCYVFGVPKKYGQDGFMPLYVGRTNRAFSAECFNAGNLTKLNEYLRHHPATSLKLILLPHPPNKGGSNSAVIADLERELIKMAKDVNPKLLNKQHVHPDEWGIHGVIRGGSGKPGLGSILLAQMLNVP